LIWAGKITNVCVLIGLVAFFSGAHAQIATSNPAATATPARTTDYAARIKGAVLGVGRGLGVGKVSKTQ
jgi:hypothetical protein